MSYTPAFEIVSKPSSFPNAFVRTFAPRVLQVVHVTGNKDVAALPDGLTSGHSPYQDWLYAALNPASADGPSANNYVGRAGSTIEMWNPATHVAWSNGDVVVPNLTLPGVRYLADLRAKGVNANKGCYREIELSGYPGSFDPTDAQLEVAAYFAAIDSITTGLDIIRGETMLTHADINTIDRQNCAFRPTIREARMAQLITRALAIRDAIKETPVMASFSFDPSKVKVGTLRLNGPGHYYMLAADGSGHGPLDPADPRWIDRPAIGPVNLLTPWVGETLVYVVGGNAAYLRAVDVIFTETGDTTPYSAADVQAKLDALKASARAEIVWPS